MKKSTIKVLLTLLAITTFFQSCNGKSGNKGEAKEPTELKKDSNSPSVEEPKTPQTLIIKNMHGAYRREKTAQINYAAYSEKSAEEGHTEIALLFNGSSGAELTHTNNHNVLLLRMGERIPEIKPVFTVKSTKENLIDSEEGERYEFTTMYPRFIKNASATGNYRAQISLIYTYKVA